MAKVPWVLTHSSVAAASAASEPNEQNELFELIGLEMVAAVLQRFERTCFQMASRGVRRGARSLRRQRASTATSPSPWHRCPSLRPSFHAPPSPSMLLLLSPNNHQHETPLDLH